MAPLERVLPVADLEGHANNSMEELSSTLAKSQSDWVVFSELGPSTDLNVTFQNMKIQTSFRLQDNPPESQPVDVSQKPSEDYPMITIYCSLLGLIIITLLLYVVYKLWQQHLVSGDFKVASNETPNRQGLFGGLADCNKLRKAHTDHAGETISEKDGLLMDDSSVSTYNNERPASSLPPYVLSRLAEEIVRNGQWKSIGSQLGFTEENLHEFEVAAAAAAAAAAPTTNAEPGKYEHTVDVNAAYHMLTTWVSRPGSKVGTLQQTVCQSLAAGCDTSLCRLFDPTFCPPAGWSPSESVGDGRGPPAYSPADVPM
ncbi:unnamed protein product [Schistocephalus solidus]|uniref:TNFR_16_TM domain-containing protein n=1 Tax=Schistocephalus solidus TaxID=70667 RepID=A0A183ST10_SCHSO|nr:unnamed protein product [Schistocephalus solidus]